MKLEKRINDCLEITKYDKLRKELSLATIPKDILELNAEQKKVIDKLYPFQVAALEYIELNGGYALIADEMGTGKTVMSISHLLLHPEKRPVLVICPLSSKYVWKNHIKDWAKKDACILDSKTKVTPNAQWYVIHYDALFKRYTELEKIKFGCIIVDECHRIKNYGAKRSRYSFELIWKNTQSVLFLSGTPIKRYPDDIWQISMTVAPHVFHSWYPNATFNKTKFDSYFCGKTTVVYGRKRIPKYCPAHQSELGDLLRRFVMIRRLKKDVLTQLPEKTRTWIVVDNVNKEYKELENNLLERIKTESTSRNIDLTKVKFSKMSMEFKEMSQLRQLAFIDKIPYIIDHINSILDNDESVVVFTMFHASTDILVSKLKELNIECAVIDGRVNAEKRNDIIQSFKDKKVNVLIGSIPTIGESIDLTNSSSALVAELDWTPVNMLQAEDRLHRITQKENVNIYYYITKGTIEEHIMNIIKSKLESSTSVYSENIDYGTLIMTSWLTNR